MEAEHEKEKGLVSVDISPACILKFDWEKTIAEPAKIDPDHQIVVFSNKKYGQEQRLTRSEVYNMLGNTNKVNLDKYGISTTDAAKGYFSSDYSVLTQDQVA